MMAAATSHHPHIAVNRGTINSAFISRTQLLAHPLTTCRRHIKRSMSVYASSTFETGNKTTTTWQIYNGRMPLVGMESLASALKGTPLQQLLQMHTYILLEGPDQVWYFDFLPLRPTSPATALLLLTAGSAPGELRVKQLDAKAVKTNENIRLVGKCLQEDPLAAAREYNRKYNTDLHLLKNNCKHHTSGLTQLLLQH